MRFSIGFVLCFVLPFIEFYLVFHLEEEFAEINAAMKKSLLPFVNSFWKSKEYSDYLEELREQEQLELGPDESLEPEEGTEKFRE